MLLNLMLGTEELTLPNLGSAQQYKHKTQFASAGFKCAPEERGVPHKNCGHKLNTVTENILKTSLQYEQLR
jgi:hypothetical protein